MKRITTAIAILFATIGFAQAAGNAEAGQAKAGMCMGCHGPDGNSFVPMFPSLAGQGEGYLVKQMSDIKSNARVVNEMAGILLALTDEDMANVAAFYSSQTAKQGQGANAELAELGKSLYMGGNIETGVTACAACHGAEGEGNAAAKFPMLKGQHALYVSNQLNKFRLGARHNGAAVATARINDGDTKMMRDISFKLKDFEIEALAAYIAGM